MRRILALVMAAALASAAGGLAVNAQSAAAVAFNAADLKVEINATDGDAGLQVFLDHEPWRAISLLKPDGSKIVDFRTKGGLRNYGLTELFSESSEPPFTEFPLAKFKQLFPAGNYTFLGETIEGKKMRSIVPLTHNFPAGPNILSPVDGSTVPAGPVVVRWTPVTELEIVAYQVVVTKEDPKRVLEATVLNTVTQFTVPAEFIQAGTEFKAEVLAIEESGNQTLTEVTFSTS